MSEPKLLNTVEDVISALGGLGATQKLTQAASYQVVQNWRMREQFPANLYVVMTEALRELGYTAPERLWGQKSAGTLTEESVTA